jgi:hypothetical protein
MSTTPWGRVDLRVTAPEYINSGIAAKPSCITFVQNPLAARPTCDRIQTEGRLGNFRGAAPF